MSSSCHLIAIAVGATVLFSYSSGGAGTVSAVAATGGKASTTALSMGDGASGAPSSSLFGSNARDLGHTWILYDPSGNGKTALGIVGATAP